MKNKFILQIAILIAILFSQNNFVKSQWVTIPDTNFASFLQIFYPTCMNGDQMDTTCSDIVNETYLDCSYRQIYDIEGIQYFSNLNELICYNNYLTILPELPNSITLLDCSSNQLNSLSELPNSLTWLNCSGNQFTSLPELPNSLITLGCSLNQLSSLPELPNNLLIISCGYNQLSTLPELPSSLYEMQVDGNQISHLPELPSSLTNLSCADNQLTLLPELPNSLTWLECLENQLTSLPELPNSLTLLDCSSNQLVSLPELPNSLTWLVCGDNELTSLPELPNGLIEVNCPYNQLTILPELPNSLIYLSCYNNQLTYLPELPNSLYVLSCNMNQLTTLPGLPDSFYLLECYDNQISCFPVFPESITYLEISDNPFTCLPNYTYLMGADLLAYPLCQEGDFINNPNNCESAKGISGSIYKDVNADCINNASDLPSQNIPVQLFDESDNLIATYYSSAGGSYNFYQFSGTYTITLDTLNKPYTVSCPEIGIDSTVVLDENNTLVDSVSFAIECKPGFDLRVQSITQSGWVFPGLQHQVNVGAGDILSFYNLNCTNGSGGMVQINVTGSVTYDGVALGALVPDAIVGNSFTYNIADFGTLSSNSFGLLFLTDTTAQAGETVCITASITPDEIDNDTTNNTLTYCYPVTNSYDPNEKEVYPTSVLPNYDGYFTYTIHFQNTGTAPAVNIKVQDTLSTYLDLSTFEITAYSHPNNTTLTGNLISFKFPNIWLPDSTSNLEGSKGFIQYRIKPLPGLPLGAQITNTAYIYFDYNDPIQTNITTSNFEIINGIKAYSKGKVNIYPNPNNGMFHVNLLEKNQNEKTMELTNLMGEKVWSQKTKSNSTTIDINHLPKGIYILNITDIDSHFTERIIKN